MKVRRILGSAAVSLTTAVLFAVAGTATADAGKKLSAGEYPAPRYLKSLMDPSPEALLRAARLAVRQPYGLAGLGRAERGWTVHVFLPYNQDMPTFTALQQAWAERGVTAVGVQPWEVTGETKAAYDAKVIANKALLRGSEAYKELAVFDVSYYPYLPAAAQKEAGKPMGMFNAFAEVAKYMDAHPEIQHILRDPGGAAEWFCIAAPQHCSKHVANWTYVNPIDVMNHGSEYPADVWNLVEETIAKPVAYVSEGTFVDPEGTNLHWVVSPQQAQKWAQYIKVPISNNHMFVYPNAVDTMVMEGVVAGSASHTGFYPSMKIHLSQHGRVVSVEGGGKTGDSFRALLNHPKFSPDKVCFPTLPECGYWFLSSDGFATNPKKVRNMITLTKGSTDLPNMWERERAGVQHLSFTGGSGMFPVKRPAVQQALREGKTGIGIHLTDPRLLEYAFANDVPTGHTNHIHNYFATLKYRLRDTGEWITISEKGRPTAFDNPEVRALAAKYGDPEAIFSYDWIPAIPGINVPGDYARDYSADPWKWVSKEWEQIRNGTYRYFIPDYQMTRDSVETRKQAKASN
jgi:hypothetical protein